MTLAVYKYRSMATPIDTERTLDILDNQRLYCAAPGSFNDPYECHCLLEFDAPEDIKNNRAIEQLRHEFPGLTHEEHVRMAPAKWRDLEARKRGAFRNHLQRSAGVVSFGGRPDIPLMWSHYAGSHDGICLEFRASTESHVDLFGQILQVRYVSAPPVINFYSTSPQERLHAYVLTKAKHWEYEEEWRYVAPAAPANRLITVPDGLLTAVILGARISDPNRREVLKRLVIDAAAERVRVFQAALHQATYELRFSEVVPDLGG